MRDISRCESISLKKPFPRCAECLARNLQYMGPIRRTTLQQTARVLGSPLKQGGSESALSKGRMNLSKHRDSILAGCVVRSQSRACHEPSACPSVERTNGFTRRFRHKVLPDEGLLSSNDQTTISLETRGCELQDSRDIATPE